MKRSALCVIVNISLVMVFIWSSSVFAETFVSGTVVTSDGMVVTSGVVALERGELHNNEFLTGGAVGPDGRFRIPLPAGGKWGLHVYSERYLYFPLQVVIQEDQDNEVPVVLPVDSSTKDDAVLSDIRFESAGSGSFRVKMTVRDGDDNLGPQVLAVDAVNYRSYRLVPVGGDLTDMKADFPQGDYVSQKIEGDLNSIDKSKWIFVAADHQCNNGVIYSGLNQSIYAKPIPRPDPIRCEIPGIWKSNFDRTFLFTSIGPDRFTGKQFEETLTVNEITKKGDSVHFSLAFAKEEGQADLTLNCSKNTVEMKGPFRFPESGRQGTWILTKIKNEKTGLSGQTLFNNNCAVCHFTDSHAKKVGPGLMGLFKKDTLSSGKPVSEAAVREQIKRGGGGMPPFGHLTDDELRALVEYLKTL